MSRRVTLYTKKGCHPCEEAKELLLGLQREYDLAIAEVDIESDKGLEKIYGSIIPVVALDGGRIFHSEITESQLRRALEEPARKVGGMTAQRGRDLVLLLNRLILGIAKHWLLLINSAMGLCVGLPILAPLLMAHGQTRLSNAIYFVYQTIIHCHQMPSRSFFIAGHQMALCQRDLAIYGSIFLAGVAYALMRGKVRPLPIWAFILLITPMAVDGTLQLLGVLSTPLRRLITGSLFGLACVWLLFPYLEEGFQEIREEATEQFNKAYKREGEPI